MRLFAEMGYDMDRQIGNDDEYGTTSAMGPYPPMAPLHLYHCPLPLYPVRRAEGCTITPRCYRAGRWYELVVGNHTWLQPPTAE